MNKNVLQALLAAFALLISTTAVGAYAQIPPVPGFEEVSGPYTNAEAGVSITFPDGWSGVAFGNATSKFITLTPGGMGADMEKAMMLMIVAKSNTQNPPTNPSNISDQAPDCPPPVPVQTTVSGKNAMEMTMECTDSDGKTVKMKMTMVETEDKWVGVMYMSPIAEFDADVGKYDAAVDSLQVQGAIDAIMGGGPPAVMTPKVMPVMVAGGSVDVSVESSSTISEFKLDEASKMLSFKADGTGDKTVVSVGSVLEGPYSVMVDGAPTTNFVESTSSGGVKTLSVSHATGSHSVTITGTQVVPEFPILMLGIVGALIAAISIIGRTRLVKGKF